MSKEISFLKAIEDSQVDFDFEVEQDSGKITEFRIPMEWFSSKNISKEIFEKAIRELLEEEIVYRQENGSHNTIENYRSRASNKHPDQPDIIQGFKVKKDENGHVYLEVLGQDDWSKLLIHQDGMRLSRRDGYKIPETVLINKIKQISDRQKVEEYIKSVGGSLSSENLDMKKIYELINNIQENDTPGDLEEAGRSISDYADYIRQEVIDLTESTISCRVAEEQVGPRGPRTGKTPAIRRVNDVIDADIRFDFLKNLHPQYTINVNPIGRKGISKYQFKAFVYDLARNNDDESGRMIVIEPENGTSYTRNVFVSREEISQVQEKLERSKKEDEVITEKEVYEAIVARTLAKTRSEAAMDKRIQQTSHTNEEAFKASCKYFISRDKDGLEGSILYRRVSERERMLEDK